MRRSLVAVLEHRAFPLLASVVAVSLRLAWLGWGDPVPESDFEWYFNAAQRIAAGRGYVVIYDGCPQGGAGVPLPTPGPTAYWPIGYPLFLGEILRVTAGVLPPLVAGRLANLALDVALMVVMAWCAGRIFRSRLAARL